MPGITAPLILWKYLMKRFLRLILVAALALGGTVITLCVGSGQAWAQSCCFGTQRPQAYPVGPPIPVTPTAPAGTGMNSYYGGYGALPPSPGTWLPAGLPQTTAAFLPTAAYDTRWTQTPVTYYRPVTQFDPNYGTTVTSLQPCTSYQYQAARIPLVSPRTISDFSYSADRLPTGGNLGYYPNGIGATGTVPSGVSYPTLQQLPGAGAPVTSNRMSYAPTGTSSGPAATLPLATMSPSTGGVVTANHLAPMGSLPVGSLPAASAPMPQIPITSAIPGTGTPIYTVPATAPTAMLAPTTSLMPCPNGVCMPGSIPSIPGATSVIPLGPPTLVSPSNPQFMPPKPSTTSTMPLAPNVTNPILPNPGDIKPIMPPSGDDPEATRPPSLGGSTAMFPLKRVPVAEFDPASEFRAGAAKPQNLDPSPTSSTSRVTPSEVPPGDRVQPLKAPVDFDAKPRWNPKLTPRPSGEARETVASTSAMSSVTV